MEREERIVQISPARGWVAVFKEGDDEYEQPLACFALVEYRGDLNTDYLIEPVIYDPECGFDLCHKIQNFQKLRCYLQAGEKVL
jgi:hypothetical protein